MDSYKKKAIKFKHMYILPVAQINYITPKRASCIYIPLNIFLKTFYVYIMTVLTIKRGSILFPITLCFK